MKRKSGDLGDALAVGDLHHVHSYLDQQRNTRSITRCKPHQAVRESGQKTSVRSQK